MVGGAFVFASVSHIDGCLSTGFEVCISIDCIVGAHWTYGVHSGLFGRTSHCVFRKSKYNDGGQFWFRCVCDIFANCLLSCIPIHYGGKVGCCGIFETILLLDGKSSLFPIGCLVMLGCGSVCYWTCHCQYWSDGRILQLAMVLVQGIGYLVWYPLCLP